MTRIPRIGLNCDLEDGKFLLKQNYVQAVIAAGGRPVFLPPLGTQFPVEELLDDLDALVLTGGDDPHMDAFGEEQHPLTTPMARDRQDFDLAIVRAALRRPEFPVLGICAGMQMMGLASGARYIQHLPDVLASWAEHEGDFEHEVAGDLGTGRVASRHHQALATSGSLIATMKSPDGVLEGVRVPGADHQIGVQWHPERTRHHAFGLGLFEALVARARQQIR